MNKYSNFIYLPSHNFVFAYVPKVACTNWKCIFRGLAGYADYLDAGLAHDRVRSGLEYLNNENASILLSDNSVRKFTFVRNPYSRILSAYLNKIKKFALDNFDKEKDHHFYQVFCNIEQFRENNDFEENYVSFNVFLNWLKNKGGGDDFGIFDEHWRPQSDLILSEEVAYDFVGRFENIQKDSEEILREIGTTLRFPTQTEVKFPPTRAASLMSRYYTSREARLVLDVYKEDFELLGYSEEFPA